MYIVAIAWLYVVLMMAITSKTVLAGIGVILFYGLLPLSVVMYILGAPQRWKAKRKAEQQARAAFTAKVAEAPKQNDD